MIGERLAPLDAPAVFVLCLKPHGILFRLCLPVRLTVPGFPAFQLALGTVRSVVRDLQCVLAITDLIDQIDQLRMDSRAACGTASMRDASPHLDLLWAKLRRSPEWRFSGSCGLSPKSLYDRNSITTLINPIQ